MLVQVWRRGRSDQIRIGENVLQSPRGLPPIDTIQDGIAETTTNEEEEREQEQQSRAWNSCCWMDRTPEACFEERALHSYPNVIFKNDGINGRTSRTVRWVYFWVAAFIFDRAKWRIGDLFSLRMNSIAVSC
jgi:hypothetical protein